VRSARGEVRGEKTRGGAAYRLPLTSYPLLLTSYFYLYLALTAPVTGVIVNRNTSPVLG
jgi:hypothetical protein